MKHAVILAHPDLNSFNAAVARAYVRGARALGHKATVRDLYARGFDPCLPACELPWGPGGYRPRADLVAERRAVKDADVIVFVYPLWFNAPPAILKGWADRVLSSGFGFHHQAGGNRPALTGRKLLTVSTSGAPGHWLASTGAFDHLRRGFDDHLAGVTGLTVADHIHFGEIVPGIRRDAVADLLAQVEAIPGKLFAGGEAP